jgi:hypothetical protein
VQSAGIDVDRGTQGAVLNVSAAIAGGGARPRCMIGHTLAGVTGVKGRGARKMREGTRPRCTVWYRLLTREAGRGGLSPGRY